MKINKTTGWSLGTTGLCVALAAGGWFGLVAPERAEAAEAREATVVAQGTNAQLEIKIDQLRQQYADLPAQQARLAAIRQALPEEAALAQLVRDLNAKSTDASTTLVSVTSSVPVAVVDPAATAVVAPVEEGATTEPAGGEASPAPAEPSTPAAPADGAAPADEGAPAVVPVAPAQPVLAAIPVVITVEGDFAASTLFLKNVQADMPRAFLVDSLVLSVQESADEEGTVQTVLTGRVFAFRDPTVIPEVPVLPATPSDG